jgi:phage host-nuclease inhibitor protein Gam
MAAELLKLASARSRVVAQLRRVSVARAQLGRVQAQLEQELDAVRRCHDRRIAALEARLARLTADLEALCRSERESILPPGRKSLLMPLGEVGFRRAEPVVRLVEGFTDEEACRLLRQARLADLVRVTEAPDKPAVRKALDGGRLTLQRLRRCGLEVEAGEERFHCTLRPAALGSAPPLGRASR